MHPEETKIYYYLLIATFIILVIFAMFVASVVKQYRKNSALYKQKLQAEIHAAETERTSIARDLHDDIGPLLAAVRMHIRKATPESTEKAVSFIDDVMTQLRAVSHKLMPVSLSRTHLLNAVREYCETVSEAGDMQIICTGDESISLGENDIHLYRIVHEIIHNAVKHSKATHMQVCLQKENDRIVLQVNDNGIGADVQAMKAKGLGLMNIASRVELLDGEMFIERRGGLHYRIEIPYIATAPTSIAHEEIHISDSGR